MLMGSMEEEKDMIKRVDGGGIRHCDARVLMSVLWWDD